jgi:predicted O-methyltransferase YrrM
MKHFYKNIQGWFHFQELYREEVTKAKDGAIFVEVGCWKGKSTAFLAVEIINSAKAIQLYCVDHWDDSDPLAKKHGVQDIFTQFVQNLAPVIGHINVICGKSVEVAKRYDDNSIDFLMLDAAHDYKNVRADIDAWLPKLKPGATFGGDDWNWSGVHRAASETFSNITILGQGKGRHWKTTKELS